MSKRVQFAHSYPNLTSAPANEALRTVIFTKSDGVYAVLADGTVIGPLGAGGSGDGTFDEVVIAPGFTDIDNTFILDYAGLSTSGDVHATLVQSSTMSVGGGGVTSDGPISTPDSIIVGGGLFGVYESARFVGGTTTGAPTTGSFLEGDFVIDHSGAVWICTVAGSPGTWVGAGGSDEAIFQQASEPAGAVENDLWIDTDEVVLAAVDAVEPFIAYAGGTAAVVTGKSRIYLDASYSVVSVRVGVNTAPTGATLIVDVNKNGTSIYTTQADRPAIADSAFTAVGGATGLAATLAAGDYITVDVDQVGSTVAGADLTVVIRLRRTS